MRKVTDTQALSARNALEAARLLHARSKTSLTMLRVTEMQALSAYDVLKSYCMQQDSCPECQFGRAGACIMMDDIPAGWPALEIKDRGDGT